MNYLDFGVLTYEPNGAEGWSENYNQAVFSLETPTGTFRNVQVGRHPLIDRPYNFFLEDRNNIGQFRSFYLGNMGRLRPFWVPTWRRDFALMRDYLPTDTTLTIRDIGYVENFFPHHPRRHLAFVSPRGEITPRRVMSAVKGTAGTEVLTLNDPAPVTIVAVSMFGGIVCFLVLCRQMEDTVEMHWHSPNMAEATMRFVEIPHEVPTL